MEEKKNEAAEGFPFNWAVFRAYEGEEKEDEEDRAAITCAALRNFSLAFFPGRKIEVFWERDDWN